MNLRDLHTTQKTEEQPRSFNNLVITFVLSLQLLFAFAEAVCLLDDLITLLRYEFTVATQFCSYLRQLGDEQLELGELRLEQLHLALTALVVTFVGAAFALERYHVVGEDKCTRER